MGCFSFGICNIQNISILRSSLHFYHKADSKRIRQLFLYLILDGLLKIPGAPLLHGCLWASLFVCLLFLNNDTLGSSVTRSKFLISNKIAHRRICSRAPIQWFGVGTRQKAGKRAGTRVQCRDFSSRPELTLAMFSTVCCAEHYCFIEIETTVKEPQA